MARQKCHISIENEKKDTESKKKLYFPLTIPPECRRLLIKGRGEVESPWKIKKSKESKNYEK